MRGLLLICVVVAAASVAHAVDPCAAYPTCTQCVAHYLCGWCSVDVVYPHNVTGAQCAGFSKNGSTPFQCNGIYSTEVCFAGYTCDPVNFTCVAAQPGEGVPLEQCQANCTNNGTVYLCNITTKQCHVVPPGTPGSNSLAICEASCAHPSANPSSPQPTTIAPTYICNYTTGQCVNSTPGHGGSLQVCEQQCSKQTTAYYCNQVSHQCVQLPPGVPGPNLTACELQCNPPPKPGPPQMFKGLWRGIEIQNNYQIGEWDMKFSEKKATIVDVAGAVTIEGIPFNVQDGDNLDLWINITSGPQGYAGQVIKAIGQTANRGPETTFLTAAFGAPGGQVPSSVTTAMTTAGQKVFFLAQCVPGLPECVFTMPSTKKMNAMMSRRRVRVTPKAEEEITQINPADPCSPFFQNCSYCLSHQFCGWCSQPVTYQGGMVGTQCAGFNGNQNTTNPFVCAGHYSTLNCTIGYSCNATSGQCIANPNPGDGMPKALCEKICVLTPAPTPFAQYVCNTTSHQCYKCNQTHCPGSMPQATCEASCVKPKPGPTSLVMGVWRGIQISRSYPLGEYEMVFNASGVVAYQEGEQIWSGVVTSYGGDVMDITVNAGLNSGSTLSAIYTVADQTGLYSVMTLAVSAPNGQVPQNYAGPMTNPPEYERVFAKCISSPCQFNTP